MHDTKHVCVCGGGSCARGGACGCNHHQKLTVVAVGKCPACASGILEAEDGQSVAVCNVCGFTEGGRVA